MLESRVFIGPIIGGKQFCTLLLVTAFDLLDKWIIIDNIRTTTNKAAKVILFRYIKRQKQ